MFALPSARMRGLVLMLVGAVFFVLGSAAAAGPMDNLERLVMPGKLSKGHAKFEDDCNKCHKRFKKGGQTDLCLDCHKEVAKDVRGKKGFHGKMPEADNRDCKTCHTEHKGREENITPFDEDNFTHQQSDFPLKGRHSVVTCTECHKAGVKFRKAPTRCDGCHETDDTHHGRLGKDCTACHTESQWGQARFDHAKTDFRLKGGHNNILCADCHANQRYKDTPTKCFDCHQADDVHKGDNGKKCQDCHTEKNWMALTFDHDKDTDYPLDGRHEGVGCQACHNGDVYKKLDPGCLTCHQEEDVHKGLFGKKCADCHVTKAWSRTTFNHNKDTEYALRGRHLKTACTACHKGDVYADLDKNCFSCHRKDDVHEGQEGEKCDQCHNERAWVERIFFDHGLTRFPLLGGHAVASCEECHLSAAYQDAELNCSSCHAKDDEKIHKKRLGANCDLCHNATDWAVWVFDHDKTDYPLDGAHKDLDCHACHTKPVVKKIELGTSCVSCHERDDVHRGTFGRNCERCHVTASFKKLR